MDNSNRGLASSAAVLAVFVVLVFAVALGGVFTVSADGDSLSLGEEVLGDTDPFDADSDGDGLPDDEELDRGTDPTDADTDGDGLSDAAEASSHPTSPTDADTDGDGLGDAAEVEVHDADPLDPDTDGDGLGDAAELDEHGTDPTASDTDGDGLDDAAEVSEHGTDPSDQDTDGDGLTDAEELTEHSTSPTDADTDGDGLADGDEVEFGSDPHEADTDGDGLTDDREHEYSTDPTASDTDGDGLTDAEEVFAIESSSNSEWFSEASPTAMDTFVEVDYTAGNEFSEEDERYLEDAFDKAPVENPDGSSGINVHVVVADEPVSAPYEMWVDDYFDEHHETEFDTRGYGFHHALVVDEVEDRGGMDTRGVTRIGADGVLVEAQSGDYTVETLQHELGHTHGIVPDEHEGVDSTDVRCRDYPSVMNYNCQFQGDEPSFSSGDNGARDYDDWSRFIEGLPNAPTDDLEREVDGRSSR